MEDNTPWTSIDLYYKGVHIKKSLPENIKGKDLIKAIESYLDLGFKPSWNEDTNVKAKQSPLESTTQSQPMCSIHGVEMKARKGKYGTFYSHAEQKEDRAPPLKPDFGQTCDGYF